MTARIATDWRPVQRLDGSIYFECGDPRGGHHMAFDVALDDIDLAQRFCTAMNRMNNERSTT